MNLFTETGFFLILLPALALFHAFKGRGRFWVIIISGIVFYGYFAHWWVLLFFSELLISRFYRPGSRWCLLGIVQALLVLLVFKYGVFFESNLRAVLSLPEGHWAPLLNILPLAISFFTFEFIHFAADNYTGKVVERDFLKYGAFIFFFPTLVAGPIKRYQDFIPKTEKAVLSQEAIRQGITRMLIGYFKKAVIADSFIQLSRFLAPDLLPQLSGGMVWQCVIAYGLRIYFDFSGYADIAIGSALLFGIVVPENFNNPYYKPNISEFWKSWHISLYKWLVDYIYIPLGGSRAGKWTTIRNILAITTLSGIWHGAAWNFLFWGWYHGGLICLLYYFQQRGGHSGPEKTSRVWRGFAWLLTLGLVMFGWTFFAIDTRHLPMAISKMFWLK